MRACQWSVATALLLLATAVLAPPVKAESERIHIRFEAPKGCPDAAAFLRALKKWTKRFELVGEAQTTRRFVVTIHRTPSSALGRLEIRAPGAASSLRNVAGKTCDEVAAALALMTALAIDPTAQSSTPPSPTEDPADSPSGIAPHRSSEPQNTAQSAAGTTTAPAAIMPRVLPTQPRPSAPARPDPATAASFAEAGPLQPEPLRWSAGLHANLSGHVAPTRAWGGALFVETAWSGARINPVFRGGLAFSESNVALPSGAGARFRWYLAFLEGCPTHLATEDRRMALYPCLAANVGVLRAQGQDLDENESTTEVWAELGPALRFRLALSHGWSLEGQGAVVFPLRRLSFDVQDAGPGNAATPVFSTPSWGVRAGIGVAYEFR